MKKGADGKMQIVEEEAKVVREIYAMFLDGKTPSGIAAVLTKQRIPTPAGKANVAGQHGKVHPEQ